MSGHSLWSPSSLHRRLACLGSANAEEGLPDSTSEVAAEGTCAHAIREKCLKNNSVNVADFVDQVVAADGYTFTVTKDWESLLQPGIDRLRELRDSSVKSLEKALFVEQRVSLEAWMPGEGGTLDAGVIIRDKKGEVIRVYINDLKFGRDPVSALRNPQLMAYALGFLAWFDLLSNPNLEVVLEIDQPRAPGRGDSWATTAGDLLAFGEELSVAYRTGSQPGAPRTPDPHGCKYCKAADHCRELGQHIINLFNLPVAGEPMIPDSERLEVDDLAVLLRNAKLVKRALDTYETRASTELENGTLASADLGMKLVAGAGKRAWRDVEEAEKFLISKLPRKTDAFNQKLISPAEAENMLGTRNWVKAQELIEVNVGRPMLVPLSDKRQELIPVINILDDLPDEDEQDALLDDLIGNPGESQDCEVVEDDLI